MTRQFLFIRRCHGEKKELFRNGWSPGQISDYRSPQTNTTLCAT